LIIILIVLSISTAIPDFEESMVIPNEPVTISVATVELEPTFVLYEFSYKPIA